MELYKLKEKVTIGKLNNALLVQLEKIGLICKVVNGKEYVMTITSTNDGKHMNKSLHYRDRAIDIRTRDMEPANRILTQVYLKRWLGVNFDVILESDHIHIEHDPKNLLT